MLGSHSVYFHQSPEVLQLCRLDLMMYLNSQRFSIARIKIYMKVFDYFCKNPNDFDGATFVKDLYHIPGLDINAMLHDFHCVVYNVAANFYTKWFADKLYSKEMERTGKGQLAWTNFIALKSVGLLHVIFANIKRGSITIQQETAFFEDYRVLMN